MSDKDESQSFLLTKKLTELIEKNFSSDKWELLYSYSRSLLNEEIDRFQRIDDKSMKLLSATSIIITIFIGIFKWLIVDSETGFSVYIYAVSSAVFIMLSLSWYFYFLALKLIYVPRLSIDDSIFELFKIKDLSTIHVALHKSCRNAVELSRVTTEKKANKIKYGYKATSLSAIMLIILVGMVSYENITYNSESVLSEKTNEEISMTENESSQQTDAEKPDKTNEPDLDITAPELTMVTNSDDSLPTKKVEILNEKANEKGEE